MVPLKATIGTAGKKAANVVSCEKAFRNFSPLKIKMKSIKFIFWKVVKDVNFNHNHQNTGKYFQVIG